MAYQDEVLADSPLVYYRLGTGARTTDSSGNGKTLTESGTDFAARNSLLASQSDGSTEFRATGGAYHLNLDDSSTVDFPGTAQFTLELWFKPVVLDTTFRRLVSWSDDVTASTNTYGILYHSTSGIGGWRRVAGTDNVEYVVPAVYDTNTTYYVVMTYDGTDIHTFIDSVEGNSGASGSQGAYAGTFRIGIGQSGSGARAIIDEVAVYSGVLSQSRINAHYAAREVAAPPATPGGQRLLTLGAG